MENLAFLVKSYNKHLPWTKQLIDTINRPNKSNSNRYRFYRKISSFI